MKPPLCINLSHAKPHGHQFPNKQLVTLESQFYSMETKDSHSPKGTQLFQTHQSQQRDEADNYTKSEERQAKSWGQWH